MSEKKELQFSIYILYSLDDKWNMTPAAVYKILNSTGILDDYVIPCYDILHTLENIKFSKSYLDFGRGL